MIQTIVIGLFVTVVGSLIVWLILNKVKYKNKYKIKIKPSIEYSEEHNINRLKLTLMNKGNDIVTVLGVYYKNEREVNLNYHSLPLEIEPGQSDSDHFQITNDMKGKPIIIIVKDQIGNEWVRIIDVKKDIERMEKEWIQLQVPGFQVTRKKSEYEKQVSRE